MVTLAVQKSVSRVTGSRVCDVGQAVAPGHQQLAVFGDRQGPAGNSPGLEGLVHDVVKDGHSLADRRQDSASPPGPAWEAPARRGDASSEEIASGMRRHRDREGDCRGTAPCPLTTAEVLMARARRLAFPQPSSMLAKNASSAATTGTSNHAETSAGPILFHEVESYDSNERHDQARTGRNNRIDIGQTLPVRPCGVI